MKTTLALLSLALVVTFTAGIRAQDKELVEAIRKLDANLFPADSAEAKDLANSLYRGLKVHRDRSNDNDVKFWQTIRTRADWEKSRDQRMGQLVKALYSAPRADRFATPYAATPVHIGKTLAGQGFVVENIVYESRPTLLHLQDKNVPSLWVSANLYRPEPLPRERGPAIVILHSHHNAKTEAELQDMGITWARLGCHVLIPDMLGHGERRDHPFHAAKDYEGPFKVSRQDYYFRYNLGMQLHYLGESLIGWMVHDVKCGVDVLLQKGNVDRDRIILLGSVAGGGDPAAVAAALDPRIKCVVPFNFGRASAEKRDPAPADPDMAYNYVGGAGWETTRNLGGAWRGGFQPWAIVAAVAPRPLIYAHEFAWDAERDPVWKRLQKIYSFYGADDKLGVIHGKGAVTGKFPDATHCNNIGAVHRRPMYPLLKKWFNIPLPEKENEVRFKSEDLRCWTPDLRDKLKPRKAYEVMAALEENLRKGAYLSETLVSNVAPKGKTVLVRQAPLPHNVQVQWLRHVENDTGFTTTALVLLPGGEKPGQERMVVALARRGKAGFLENRSDTIAELLARGIRVCLVDLVGTGETRPGTALGRTSAATSLAAQADVLGTPVPWVQQAGLSGLLSHFTPLPIAFWLDSFAPVLGAATDLRVPHDAEKLPAISEPMNTLPLMAWRRSRAVYVRGGFADPASLYEGAFHYLPYDLIAHGKNQDMDTLVRLRLTFGSPVRVEAMVNAQNRLLTRETLERAFAHTIKNQALLREKGLPHTRFEAAIDASTPAQLAAWFVEVLKK